MHAAGGTCLIAMFVSGVRLRGRNGFRNAVCMRTRASCLENRQGENAQYSKYAVPPDQF